MDYEEMFQKAREQLDAAEAGAVNVDRNIEPLTRAVTGLGYAVLGMCLAAMEDAAREDEERAAETVKA